VRECACTGSARKNRASTRCWCVRVKGRRHSRGDGTKLTTCARQWFVLTRLLAQERQGLRSTVVCSACGYRQRAGLGVRSSEQRYDTIARQGSARSDDGSGTCKATSSARWPDLKRRRVCAAARCGTAGNNQTASSQGSVQPRLEGRVHNTVMGGRGAHQRSGRDDKAAVKGSMRGMQNSHGGRPAWNRGCRCSTRCDFQLE
jgi:hypothetical protein